MMAAGAPAARLQLGVNVTAATAGAYGAPALRHSLLEARTHGFDSVTFLPTWYLSTPGSCDLTPDPVLTPTDAALQAAMATAGELGLSIVIRPLVDLPGCYEWRTMIDPHDRPSWWARYGRMIEHYGAMAQRARASTLVIGSELAGLTGRGDDPQWRSLSARVREIFTGTVTYAASGPGEWEGVTFWDALDTIGVTLRPELEHGARASTPSVEMLLQAWEPYVRALIELHERCSRPLLITELGFRSSQSTLADPGAWHADDAPDPDRQRIGYEAAYRVLSPQPWLAGVHWWDWPSDLAATPADSTGYCPFRKPAADVAASWNRRLAGSARDPPARPTISVLVPVRNGERTIGACVSALLVQSYPRDRFEIIVIDNASTDRTREVIAGYPVRYAYEPAVGRSHARNRGIGESTAEIVAFIDGDCIADRDWLAELAGAFAREPVSAVAGEILADDPVRMAQRFMAQREARWQSVVLALSPPFAITANVAFRRDVFEHVGLFDPAFVTAEDVDLGWRFHAAGFRMSYCATATVSHRLRETPWQLFRQQEGLGYGRVLLRERYQLPAGYGLPTREEARGAVRALMESVGARASGEQIGFASLELLRVASLRTGARRRELVSRLAPLPAA
jgi:hypothetical protein